MRWVIALLFLFLGLQLVRAQHGLVLYNMRYVPQVTQLNPATFPLMRGYFGFPGLSGIKVSAGHSGFTVNQFNSAQAEGETDYGQLGRYLKPSDNRLFTDTEVQLLNFGFNLGAGYLHFSLSENMLASGTYGRSLFGMLDDIDKQRLGRSITDTVYNHADFGLNGIYYRSFGLGYAQEILPGLSVGGRLRYLQGISGLQTQNDDLSFRFSRSQDYFQIQGQMAVLASGLDVLDDAGFAPLAFGGNNSGFALDFGVQYLLNRHFELSFSTINLGQISWKKAVARQVVDKDFPSDAESIDDHLDRWDQLFEDLVDGKSSPQSGASSFTTPLPKRIFIGGNYYLRPHTSFGLVINPVMYQGSTDISFALSGNTRVGKILGLSVALGHDRYQSVTLGTGFALELGSFQLYGVTDNVLAAFNWQDSYAAQAQVGINLNFGRGKHYFEFAPEEQAFEISREEAILLEEAARPQTSEIQEVKQAQIDQAPAAVHDPRLAEVEDIKPKKKKRQPKAARERTAKPKAESTTDMSALEMPVAELNAPAILSTPASPYVKLIGVAKAADTGQVITGIKVESYTVEENGQKKLAYIGGFLNGKIDLHLVRGKSYRILVIRQGFIPQEIAIDTDRLELEQLNVEREFFLARE